MYTNTHADRNTQTHAFTYGYIPMVPYAIVQHLRRRDQRGRTSSKEVFDNMGAQGSMDSAGCPAALRASTLSLVATTAPSEGLRCMTSDDSISYFFSARWIFCELELACSCFASGPQSSDASCKDPCFAGVGVRVICRLHVKLRALMCSPTHSPADAPSESRCEGRVPPTQPRDAAFADSVASLVQSGAERDLFASCRVESRPPVQRRLF